MTKVCRLKVVSAVLLTTAIATCAYVWGDPTSDKAGKLQAGRNQPPAAPPGQGLAEEIGSTKFSKQNFVLYQTVAGDWYFALQVKPQMEAAAGARPRDIVILIDTAASQARGPLAIARQIAEQLVAASATRPDDRISIWTVNTDKATNNLTGGLVAPKSPKVAEAFTKLAQEAPYGANDLPNAIDKALGNFDGREGRQRVVVLLGSGKSLLNPINGTDRQKLCDKMIGKEIAFFTVPLGVNLEPANLHGLATGTGGLLVRNLPNDTVPATVKKLNEAIAAPVMYPSKVNLPASVVEFYPTRLPPLRSDAPTLVVGKMKLDPARVQNFDYTVEGSVVGKKTVARLREKITGTELDNFFLVGMVDQWKKADRKDTPAAFRADRALAMSQTRTNLEMDELKAQGLWAINLDKLDVAAQMFNEAKRIDPNDAEADAGAKIVAKLKGGDGKKEIKDKIDDLLNGHVGKATDQGVKIQKGAKPTRDQLGKMVALADPADKADMDAPKLPAVDNGFPPEKEPFIRQQQQRQAVEEARISGIVTEAQRQARRILANDPEAAHDVLKRTLASVRDNADLSPQTRQRLTNQLEDSLRTVDVQGVRIKRDLDERMRMEADARARIARVTENERNEEQLQRRQQAFNNLMNTGRLEEAHREALVMQADQIRRGSPITSTMVASHDMGINSVHLAEQQEVRRKTEENYLATMLQVDKSHIPFPDEPAVGFPPAAVWRELTARRKGIWESVGLGEDAEGKRAADKIKAKLSQPVNLDKGIDANTPLKDALEFLADRYDLTLIIDSKAFEAIGVQKVEEQPVSLPKMVGVSLTTALRLLLAQIKGDVYTGTYIIRRDYIEVTTTYNAAAEKVVRAYPVADLVIGIPNSVNQQALQQTLNTNQQFNNAQNPFAMGMPGMGMGLGALGALGGGGLAGGGNPFMGGAGGAFPGNFNPFQLQGGGVGNNQFGNLGGQFGLQGKTYERELMELVVKVVAPGEWYPLGPRPGQQGGAGGPPIGLQGPDPLAMDAIVPRELLNSLDYYDPAKSLVVRGSSRTHAQLSGGLLGPRPGAAPPAAMGAIAPQRDGQIVLGPGGKNNPNQQVAQGDKVDPKLQEAIDKMKAQLAAKAPTIWEDALKKMMEDPKSDHTGLVIATADFLVENRQFKHAAEFLKAELRLGIVARPWVYEALGIALQLSGGSPDEIERAQVSAVDLEPQDAKGYLKAARAMADLKNYKQAVSFSKQAAIMEPNVADAYANAMVYAADAKDPQAMAWAASQLQRQDWPIDNDELHAKAKAKVAELARALEETGRKTDAEQMRQTVKQGNTRDLIINVKWQGEADFDLKVVEDATKSTCSYLNKQTPNGGTLLGDDLSNLNKKSYIAAEAFSGKYDIIVQRVWGRPLGAKVTVEIIRFQGTPQERVELFTLTIDPTKKNEPIPLMLEGGRRKTVASVPPPAKIEDSVREDKVVPADRVLNKLRAMSDSSYEITGAIKGSASSTGVSRQQAPRVAPGLAAQADPLKVPSYQKVQSFIGSAMDMTAQTTVNPDTGEMRVRMNPVFQTSGRTATSSNPLIPGGN